MTEPKRNPNPFIRMAQESQRANQETTVLNSTIKPAVQKVTKSNTGTQAPTQKPMKKVGRGR